MHGGISAWRHRFGCAFWIFASILLPLSLCSKNSEVVSVDAGPELSIVPDAWFFELTKDGTIHAYDSTETLRWSLPTGGPIDPMVVVHPIGPYDPPTPRKPDLRQYFTSLMAKTPLKTDDGLIMSASHKTVFVVDLETGKLLQKLTTNGTVETLADDGDTDPEKAILFQRTDHAINCYEVTTGLLKWNVSFGDVLSGVSEYRPEEDFLASNQTLTLDGDSDYPRALPQGPVPAPLPPLPSPDNVLALPGGIFDGDNVTNPTSDAAGGAATANATTGFWGHGWIFGGILGCFAALICIFGGIWYHKKQNSQKQAVVVKKKKKKNQKNGRPREFPAATESESAATESLPVSTESVKVVGRLTVGRIIGHGSNGTRVCDGFLDQRPVAVKRILGESDERASKEIAALIALDTHPNVVRYYATERDEHFVYIALEKGSFNLGTMVEIQAKRDLEDDAGVRETMEKLDIALWDSQGFPTMHLMKLLRDVVEGMVHLHKLNYMHRDLKPENVLIYCNDTKLIAKVSDMGISKKLIDGATSSETSMTAGSAGWRAPEQLEAGRKQTRAVDMFSLGCLLFFCVSGGQHPFGEPLEREYNIKHGRQNIFPIDHIPEATDLLQSLLDVDPKKRLSASRVRLHPFFWSPKKRLSFLIAASDRVELEDRDAGSKVLPSLEATAGDAFGAAWDVKLDKVLLDHLKTHRNYNVGGVRDLLRVIRNKANHYRELPPNVQHLMGCIPTGYENYFRTRFPNLLMQVYNVLASHCWNEDVFATYFVEEPDAYA